MNLPEWGKEWISCFGIFYGLGLYNEDIDGFAWLRQESR